MLKFRIKSSFSDLYPNILLGHIFITVLCQLRVASAYAISDKTHGNSGCDLVIIDVDGGGDDIMAILLALYFANKGKICILGITCVGGGNTNLDYVSTNVLRALKLVKNDQVPVYRGCKSPMLSNVSETSSIFGSDGLGGLSSKITVNSSKIQQDHAVTWMYNVVCSNPGQVTLIALGPLTNLAHAQGLYPDFSSKLKRLYLMGGSMTGVGNITPMSEFNVFCDPEAAYIVFNKFDCSVAVFGWDACLTHSLPWSWYDENLANNSGSSAARFIDHMNLFTRKNYPSSSFISADLFAVAAFLAPEIVISRQRYSTNIELTGTLSRGEMIADRDNVLNKTKKVEFIVNYNVTQFESLFLQMLNNLKLEY